MKSTVEKISAQEWENRKNSIPDEYRKQCVYLCQLVEGGVPYLFTPLEYSSRGDTLLSRLKFDSGLPSLRLWSFLFSEKNRLFFAKEKGWKIFAAMKDLGQIPIITYSVPETLTFYADELWWAPCFAEDPRLLDIASNLGATDELCYVRAALGAYKSLDYFPQPDVSFAGVGSCCDDFSSVMQLIEWQGNPIHWWEIPTRYNNSPHLKHHTFKRTSFGNSDYQVNAVSLLVRQYESIVKKLEEITGKSISQDDLRGSIRQFNTLRSKISKLRELVYSQKRPPLPGLEMLLAEFIALHYCSEPIESLNVIDDLLRMVYERVEKDESPLMASHPIRIFWVSPPTDNAIMTLVEDLGGCIAGTEYMISHAFFQLDENKPPLEAIAENYMDDSMLGSCEFRVKRIISEAKKYGAEGVICTGIFGASHCAYEMKVIAKAVEQQLTIPVLSFDVPFSPNKLNQQVVNRVESFMEVLKINRSC
jgi:benzoyl-CoA reductase/2-hydroxyglutaryl-CoA dehydratase subunit BcrC/BadD/HgdB